jgi:hypothetical protein
MGLRARLRRSLTYSNVMATIAVFVALGGGAYAITLPRNSVGREQLKRNSVTSDEIKNRSVRRADLAHGLLRRGAGAAAFADGTDPTPAAQVTIKSTRVTLQRAARLYVLAAVRDPFLSCGSNPCSARWGIYVDNVPVPASAVQLQANAGESDGFPYYALFGVTGATLRVGSHDVVLGRADSGPITDVGQLGSQLGAIGLVG